MYVFTRVLHPESNRIGLALLSVLAVFFGESYLDPSFFSPGASFVFFTVLPLSQKKQAISSYICIDGSSESGAYCSKNSRPKLILRKLGCADNFSKFHPEEMVSGCLSRNGWWDLKKSGPDLPVSRVNHACECVETSSFSFF